MSAFLKGPIVEALEKAGKPIKAKDLAKILNIDTLEYRAFRRFLRELVAAGELYQVKHGRIAPPALINLVTGSLSVLRRGGAFLVPEKGGDDIYIRADDVGNACHGDRVVVRVERHGRRGPEGRVVRVLDRARTEFMGTLVRSPHFATVSPEDSRYRDVFVPLDEAGEGRDGEKVMVEILDWGSPTSGPVGRVSQVLGMPGDPGLDVLMIIKTYGLPESFPAEVERAAAKLPDAIPAAEIGSRLDLRETPVVTIDPPTARDFDDALSLTETADGNLELGVHIADVSHYVRHDDIIDREAVDRATSVYLVDRVLPMLPEKLSNHLCSLNPNVDRLAMSVLATMTPKGKVLSYRIEDTVINSNRRLTYQEVQAYFDGEKGADEHLGDVLPLVQRLRVLAQALNGKRVRRGALDFDLPTSRVLLDEEGFPVDIEKVVRTESNRLVEEFMLLANEIVARHLNSARKPAVFRVHEEPAEEKLNELHELIGRFGYVLREDKSGSVPPKELQRVLGEARGKPEEVIVHTLVLRSLMRARYDIHPLGHYGLALRDYTHFTSPIRRYPDLLVHRILRMHSGRQSPAFDHDRRFREWLDDSCVHSSDRERVAESAERDSVELKKIQFMERHVGDEFEGVVTGVEAFGFFVELQRYHVSGLVHVNNLADDYYEYWEDEVTLAGANSGRRFTLGDRVQVQVLAVKRQARQIDFLLVSEGGKVESDESPPRRMRRAKGDFEGTGSPRSRPKQAAARGKDGKAAKAKPGKPVKKGKNTRGKASKSKSRKRR